MNGILHDSLLDGLAAALVPRLNAIADLDYQTQHTVCAECGRRTARTVMFPVWDGRWTMHRRYDCGRHDL